MLGAFEDINYASDGIEQAKKKEENCEFLHSQKKEIHMMNHFSGHCTGFVVDFYSTVFGYNNGELIDGAQAISSNHQIWLIKEYANGLALRECLYW